MCTISETKFLVKILPVSIRFALRGVEWGRGRSEVGGGGGGGGGVGVERGDGNKG